MYIPAAFRETRLDALHGLIQANSFGTLVSQLDGELFATHIPFLLNAGLGPNGTLRGHFARANPHWQAFSGSESLAIFQGPHAYISPSWYASALAVPTWNYSAVHAYGKPTVMEDPTRVRALLERTVGTFESSLPEQWSTARVGDEYVTKLAQGIVAFEMPILRLEGKRKLGQNRPVADARSAAAGLQLNGDASGRAVAQQMLEVAQASGE